MPSGFGVFPYLGHGDPPRGCDCVMEHATFAEAEDHAREAVAAALWSHAAIGCGGKSVAFVRRDAFDRIWTDMVAPEVA